MASWERGDDAAAGVAAGSYDEEDVYAGDEEEECEVEEVVDDVPMHISQRVFLGSIDAARNVDALRKARIGFTLALLGAEDERVATEIATTVGGGGDIGSMDAADIKRQEFAIEDALEEDLFGKLPALLATLTEIMCVCSLAHYGAIYADSVFLLRQYHCSRAAEREDKNVLVHCVAGRSRSPSVIAAWMLAQSVEQYTSAQEAIDRIRYMRLLDVVTAMLTRSITIASRPACSAIRPWIEINSHFERELQFFHRVITARGGTEVLVPADVDALVKRRALPRVDFGPFLVQDILDGKKTITMRLESDVIDDKNSDLKDIFPHSTAIATTGEDADDGVSTTTRNPFAILHIRHVVTKNLHAINALDLQKSGFASIPELLEILKQFYPHVTEETPLLMLHFHCVGAVNPAS